MGLGSDLELLDFRVGVPYVFWLLTSHGWVTAETKKGTLPFTMLQK